MKIDFPGKVVAFNSINKGDFFIYVEDGKSLLAMKTGLDAVCFSTALHPSMTPPTIVDKGFTSMFVCAVQDVVIRPVFELESLKMGPLSLERPGPVIFDSSGSYIRAYGRDGCTDVNLASGEAGAALPRSGSIWTEHWQLVWIGKDHEKILGERGKPAFT
jgi:hypothetical protein